MKFTRAFYWITYTCSVLLISGAMGYLIALSPANTHIAVGLLFSLLCYLVLAVSIVFHFVKICNMSFAPALLAGISFSLIGGIIVVALNETAFAKTFTPNHFMEWMMTGCAIGLVNGLGMFAIPIVKGIKSGAK